MKPMERVSAKHTHLRLKGKPGFCFIGADTKSRTRDLLITNQLLYQLSYAGAGAIIETGGRGSKPARN
jgi:hypothetical protein